MATTIIILAWIGLITVTGLSAVTLFVWAVWAWQQSLEYGCRMLGMFHATFYYVRLRLNKDKPGNRKSAGRVLYARYHHLKATEPEIASGFDEQYGMKRG